MDTGQSNAARRNAYIGIVLLAIFLVAAAYIRQLQLAFHLYRHEGGRTAFTSTPLSAHFVGTVNNAPSRSGLFVMTESGGVETATAIHRNGCFVLSATKPQATLSTYAPGYTRALTNVNGGYFYARLRLSSVESGKPSSVTLTQISVWDFIRRTVKCTSSPWGP